MAALVAASAAIAVLMFARGDRRRGAGGTLADTTRPFPPASTLDTLRADSAAAGRGDSAFSDTALDSLAAAGTPVTRVLVADSAAGDSLFHGRGRCFTCHAGNAQGLTSLGPSLRDAEWLHGDGSVRSIEATIISGIATPRATPIGMPSFAAQLSPAQAYRIAGYVYTLSHPGMTVADTTR